MRSLSFPSIAADNQVNRADVPHASCLADVVPVLAAVPEETGAAGKRR